MRLTADRRVIIGQGITDTTADGNLHICQVTSIAIALNNQSAGNNNIIQWQDGGNAKWNLGGNGNADFALYSHEATKNFLIMNGGTETAEFYVNVNVGTSSTSDQAAKLYIYENDSAFGNTGIHIENAKADDAAVIVLEGARTSENDTGQIVFRNSDDNVARIAAFSGHGSNNDSGELQFAVSADGTGDSITTAMTIDTNGNVGIGTNNPGQALEINKSGANLKVISDANVYLSLDSTQTNGDEWHIFNANSGATSTLQFKNVDQTAYPLILTEDGYAGFNNVSPTQAIDVTGNIIACLLYTSPSPRDRTRSRMPSSA